MYFNGAICDLYFGEGAGEKFMEDMDNAKRSVKIVSPFLSPLLTKELVGIHYRDVGVRLVTMDTIKDFHEPGQKILHQLILQDRILDFEKQALQSKWAKWKHQLSYFFVITSLLLGVFAIWRDLVFLWGLLPLLLVLLLIGRYAYKVRNIKIYRYSYRKLFPFKIVAVPDSESLSHPFIYEKMYLIDEEIAYLGALDFFEKDTKSRYGIQIRISDPMVIKELINEFEALFHNADLPERDIAQWGKQLYAEPGN